MKKWSKVYNSLYYEFYIPTTSSPNEGIQFLERVFDYISHDVTTGFLYLLNFENHEVNDLKNMSRRNWNFE